MTDASTQPQGGFIGLALVRSPAGDLAAAGPV
jgi:hypothetical protein